MLDREEMKIRSEWKKLEESFNSMTLNSIAEGEPSMLGAPVVTQGRVSFLKKFIPQIVAQLGMPEEKSSIKTNEDLIKYFKQLIIQLGGK